MTEVPVEEIIKVQRSIMGEEYLVYNEDCGYFTTIAVGCTPTLDVGIENLHRVFFRVLNSPTHLHVVERVPDQGW